MTKLDKMYYIWLLDAVTSKKEQNDYSLVFTTLYSTEFVSYDEFDDNLCENALYLRDHFYEFSATTRKLKGIYGEIEGPTNVLEVMVYLATRIEDTIMSNSDYGDRTGLWFWCMMESLDIIRYDNLRFDEPDVVQKLANFIERRYEKNGFGGLFTVEKRGFDARKTNIWQQAMEFVTLFAESSGELF